MNVPKFLLISPGYNCEEYVASCAESIWRQDAYYPAEQMFVDDGSTDNTGPAMLGATSVFRYTSVRSTGANFGAAYARRFALEHAAKMVPDFEERIIVLLDADDRLLPNALRKIAEQYKRGVWMAYGNYVTDGGFIYPKEYLHYSEEDFRTKRFRKIRYRTTHARTFLGALWKKIHPDREKINGAYPRTATEAELMYSLLELCGRPERVGVVEEPIYRYLQHGKSATRRYGQSAKTDVLTEISGREPLDTLIRL